MIQKNHNMLEQLAGDSKALDRALSGEELSYNDGMELMNYDNLHLLGAVADATRKKLVGDTVTLIIFIYLEQLQMLQEKN
jgi:aminodeoxyfutalosine synthase